MLRLFLAAFLVFVTLTFICQAQDTPVALPVVNSAANPNDQHTLEQQTFYFVNQYRKINKMPPLEWDASIAKVARGHSKDMASGKVDFGHDGFSQRIADLKTVLVGLRGAGENVLKTDDPNDVARAAVDLWLRSPHHLKNIRGDYNYSGMGVWEDKDGMIYFTQIFVKLQPPAKPDAIAPSQPPQVISPFNFLAPPKSR